DAPRQIMIIDRERAARLGLSQDEIVQALRAALSGDDATYAMDGRSKYALPVRLRLSAGDQSSMPQLLALRVRRAGGALGPLSEVVHVQDSGWEKTILHKDLLPYAYVLGDDAGKADSPLYGMFAMVGELARNALAGHSLDQHFIAQPDDTTRFAIKWDGEWQ